MYGEAEWREVHRLRAGGMPKAQIAERMGVSRNTVDKLLLMKEPPRYTKRVKLTKHEEEVLRTFARVLLEEAFLVLRSNREQSEK